MAPLIGMTMGCPVGIGPEIILKFFAEQITGGFFSPVVFGDAGVLNHTAATLGIPAEIVSWRPGDPIQPGTIPVCCCSSLDIERLEWGRPNALTGKAMVIYIEESVRLIQEDVLSGMVTCPITKAALKLAGCDYPGHTEMLAHLTGCDRYLMMMAGDRLKVTLVTIHEPISLVPALVTREKVTDCIRITARALQTDFGILTPAIGVAALNPHGGEQGMFGREELDIIGPAIDLYSGDAVISGPWPPDTVFYRALRGEFDAVIAMYHDQGLIPFKMVHFHDGVNVTLGLPIVRTSVDHGTAYDIAGQGCADCSSLQAAWDMAGCIVSNRAARGRVDG